MKVSVAASFLGLHVAAGIAAPMPVPAAPVAPVLPRLTDAAIQKAVREVLDESPRGSSLPHESGTLLGGKYENFSRQFSDAKVPDCLGPDGLKRQPTGIGPFALGGLLAAPFVLVAKMRGKCN